MLRALYAGVSGMNANITEIDVIGNNIANANTVGFKAGRVTFNEMLTQKISSASRPVSGGLGGRNPQQIGLGTLVGGIDTNFTQGNFQTTGIKTDLAIQGNGFFVLSDGAMNHYTRAGTFGLDADNNLVNPTTGMKLQGVMADSTGVVAGGAITDLFIDPSLVMPAAASTEVQIMGNLDADSDAMETIMESTSLLATADGADLLTSLYGTDGSDFGLHDGDLISSSFRLEDGANTLYSPAPFVIGAANPADGGNTLQDLVDWLDTQFNAAGLDFDLAADGSLEVTNSSGFNVVGLAVSVGGAGEFNANLTFPTIIANGATVSTITAGGLGQLRAPATEADALVDVFNEAGQSLGLDLSSGSTNLMIQGTRGGSAITALTMPVTAATTVAEFLTQMQSAFRTTQSPVIDENGVITFHGDVGLANALGDISVTELRAPGADNNSVIERSFNFTPTQAARDEQEFSVATNVYDSLGGIHSVSFTFEKVSGLNEWIWTATLEGGEEMLSGSTGRARFSEEGTITNFTFADGSSTLQFRPQATGLEGAEVVSLVIDYGDVGTLNGLTQFVGNASLQSLADGYAAGDLIDYDIDQNGYVIGVFSNDTVRNLARISIAQFANPEGLMREANNSYRLSGNSGAALLTFAGESDSVSLLPGTLETSNVDLAAEFTRLVIAQRAFQANARVITTGDTVMQELVSLVR